MTIINFETSKNTIIKNYVKDTNKRLKDNSIATLFFKKSSFAYLLEEETSFIIIFNLETTFFFNLPKPIIRLIIKRAIKKEGYNFKVKSLSNKEVIKAFCNL
jgi:hypothetical protein